jgi:hypothetical protein
MLVDGRLLLTVRAMEVKVNGRGALALSISRLAARRLGA